MIRRQTCLRLSARRLSLGFGAACLVMLVAGCQTPPRSGPSSTQAKAGGQGPGTGAEVIAARDEDRSVEQGDVSSTADDLTIKAPEIYRGTGVLTRRPAREKLGVDLEENGLVTLNFANAEVREVVDVVLGETLGVSYIIDPKVQGQVTARTSRPIPRSAVIPALENILALNGAALTLDDGIYKVLTLEQASATLSAPIVAPNPGDLARGFGITVIPLKFASAQEIADILQPFVTAGRVLRVDPARNLLMYAGTGTEAADLIDMVAVFDVDWMAGMSFALFPLQVADAKSLVEDLDRVFLEAGSPLAGVIRLVPIERLNAVLVISPQPAYLERAELWIDRFDRGTEGAGRRIFVYHLQNTRSADIAEVLSQIFEVEISSARAGGLAELAPGLSQTTIGTGSEPGRRQQAAEAGEGGQGTGATGQAAPAEPVVPIAAAGRRTNELGSIAAIEDSGNIRIVADEKNNALVILATAAEYRMIEATLKRLDLTPLQVLIEVTIAEVLLNDDLRYGLQWFFDSGNSSFAFSTLADGAVSSAFPGFSYVFSTPNKRIVLNALTEVTDVRVISSPQLMVLDNESARLQVGDQVPIATQSAVSVVDPESPIVNSIQFRDTGVILEVTPRVNASGLVVLEVLQEVSDVVETTTSAIDSPTIQQRSIESTVAVQSGDAVALGGLIRDRNEDSKSGIPILSEIPILGNLFRTTQKIVRRTELLVLITPRVVRDRREALDVTNELRRRLSAVEPLEEKIRPPAEPSAGTAQ